MNLDLNLEEAELIIDALSLRVWFKPDPKVDSNPAELVDITSLQYKILCLDKSGVLMKRLEKRTEQLLSTDELVKMHNMIAKMWHDISKQID
jgi:hypothetical protein